MKSVRDIGVCRIAHPKQPDFPTKPADYIPPERLPPVSRSRAVEGAGAYYRPGSSPPHRITPPTDLLLSTCHRASRAPTIPLKRSVTMWRWARVVCVVCAVCAACAARELDPAACAARFDVQRDKIIRTEESRAMGARYLSELDVGSRLECRRLCCETDSCDVFVYDEKSVGSCYLFNCGPPEDFRCKFAPHTNFSVGVLALSRRLAELQDQERLAALAAPPPATTTTTTPPPPPIVTAAVVKPAPPSRCSRYQFECRVGGECIAVYNACDGVPQCADGSDEAPELGCPAPPPVPTTTRPPPPPPVLPAAAEPESVYQESRAVEGEWPHRLVQAQPRRRPVEPEPVEEAPHIFSHKGGLVQAPQYGAFEPPAAWPRGWPPAPLPAPAPHSHRQHLTPGAVAGDSAWAEWARGWPVPGAEPELEPPSPRVDPEVQPYLMGGKTMPELPVPYSSQQHTLRDSPKKGLGLQPAPPPAPAAPAAPDKPPVLSQPRPIEVSAAAPVEPAHTASEAHAAAHEAHETHTSHETHSAHAAHVEHAAVRAEDGEGDGLSEHPPAAVLLLVLGVSMTGLAGALAGCRARAARRRLRRGKASFAHDADYLVNGMYL